MRLTFYQLLLIGLWVGVASAGVTNAQNLEDAQITLELHHVPLREALAQLENQVKVKFAFSKEFIHLDTDVSLVAKDDKLFTVLDNLLHPLQIHYKLIGKKIVLKKLTAIPASGGIAAPVPVTGKVTDDQDSPVPGVNILVKGTTTGTTTDVNGAYVITVPDAESVLVFSFVGYVTQEAKVGSRTIINTALVPDQKTLDEVVVTALGIERQEKALGYSAPKLNGDQVSNVKESNVINLLAGKVAGVNVRKTSSDPGATSLITIRGQSSLAGNNQPLFVVDGVPIANSTGNVSERVGKGVVDYGNQAADINPDDIASITVLKGASAAALYGSRAGNGVILITTKSGKTAQKGLGVSVNSTVMFDKAWQFPDFQNEFGAGERPGTDETISSASWGPRLNVGTSHVQWNSPLDANGDPIPTPWVAYPNRHRDFYETGRTLTNNVSVTGNNSQGNFRLSYTNMDNKGIVPNTDLTRTTINLAAGYNLSKKLNINTNLTYTRTGSDNRPAGNRGSVNEIVYTTTPNVDINSLRNYWIPGKEGLEQFSHLPGDTDNPFLVAYEETNAFFRNRLTGNVQLNYQFTPEFSVMLRSGTDLYNEERESKRPFSSNRNPQGAYALENVYFNERNSDFLLTYKKNLSPDWFISVSAGGNQMNQDARNSAQSTQKLSIPGVYNISNAAAGTLVGTSYNATKRINSLYGMAQVAYRNMLFLDLTSRNDWSSTLPEAHNSFFYPSASLSAVISDMLKISPSGPLSMAKLRANVAQVGKDTGPYQLYNTYGFGADWGDVKRAGTDQTLKNNNLKPEINTSYELGADLRFFKGRLGLDITYYHTSSRNQILSIPTTSASGYTGKIINAGEIQNQGWEIGLTATPLNGAFKWDVSANITRNRNKVVELTGDITEYQLGGADGVDYLIREGSQMGDFYGRTWLKVPDGPYKGEPILDGETGEYQRVNEKTKIGNYNPDFLIGFTNNFTYKNFTLYFLIDWRQGGQFYSYTAKNVLSDGRTTVTLPGRDTQTGGLAWTDDQGRQRTDGTITKGVVDNGDGTYSPNTVIMEPEPYYGSYYWDFAERSTFSATYVKLREASLSYTFPKKLLGKFPVSNLSLAIIGRNLYSYTAADNGYDPESAVNISTGGFSQGVATWGLPNTRSYGFKIGFNF